ncbi:MAG: MMPL family transporter [Nostocoides sp.]
MALALYRLGRWCAEHVRRVVAGWLSLLILLGAAAVALGTPMSDVFTIPGASFQEVAAHVGKRLPAAAGGVGTVVVSTTDGKPFTTSQLDAIHTTMDDWAGMPHVKRVQDPFATQADLDGAGAKLATAKTQLDDGKKQLDQGQAQLASAKGQLDFLNTAIQDSAAKNPNDPALADMRANLTQGQQQYEQGSAKLEKARAQYESGKAAYDQGLATHEMINGLRFVIAADNRAIIQIQFDTDPQTISPTIREKIPTAGTSLAAAGVHADYSVEITQKISLAGPGEAIGLAVAVAVLIIMLGTLVAAGLPLLAALTGVGVGLAGAIAGSHFYTLNSVTPSLALMLGLAVGIDYSLFIVNRHRGFYLGGMPLHESISRALGTAGTAVTFAGMTVVLALVGLVLSGIPILTQMGLVASFTVTMAVLVALTLTPAMLAVLGRRVASKRTWAAAESDRVRANADAADATAPGVPHERLEDTGGWYVAILQRRPWAVVFAVIAAVAVIAIPAADLRMGLPDGSSEPQDSTAYATYAQIEEYFGPGMNGALVLVADLPEGTTTETAAATSAALGMTIARMDGIAHVLPIGQSSDHRTLAYQVVPSTGPSEAKTQETVQILRDSASELGRPYQASIGLTGATVANIEISERLAGVLPVYLLIVVGLSLLILLIVFRSIVVPLVATGGFLLSLGAAFGATVAVYQWGWLSDVFGVTRPGPILSFMPIVLIGVLFGLAMDYQMFLVSGIHAAYAHGEDARSAIRSGFLHGAKVVTAAAIIMTSVFGGFVFSHLSMIRPIGLGMAVGVLVDALVVRLTFTPAVLTLLGDAAWRLPAWLDRILPDLDVEGRAIEERSLPQTQEVPPGRHATT